MPPKKGAGPLHTGVAVASTMRRDTADDQRQAYSQRFAVLAHAREVDTVLLSAATANAAEPLSHRPMHACQFLARSCGGTLANAAGGGGDGEGLAHQQSLPFDRETLETPC